MNSTRTQFLSSDFIKGFGSDSGTARLMKDIGDLKAEDGYCMIGGGNPAVFPEVSEILRRNLQSIANSPEKFSRMFEKYSSPIGIPEVLEQLSEYFTAKFNRKISAKNIALVNSSQMLCYILFNMFGGASANGRKSIFFPIFPEYIGYLDCGVPRDIFIGGEPATETIDDMLFKYKIDFDRLDIPDNAGALCVSRPSNPTGNVITDDEIEKLRTLSASRDIPLILDCAYGAPFPNLNYTPTRLVWDEQMIYCMSLSKLGLPGTRTGIALASEENIARIASVNAGMALAVNSTGQAMLSELLSSGDLELICNGLLRDKYKQKLNNAVATLRDLRQRYNFRVHQPEGAFFLWLHFPKLKISSQEFYNKLKERKVIVVPGCYFTTKQGPNVTDGCIRVNYAQPEHVVAEGLETIMKTMHEFS